jgi:uncharacterized membrane protein YqgA involved in biofilm formation
MPNVLRNVLAVIAGVVIGSVINMAIVMVSPFLIPAPPGVDVNDAESLAKGIHLFGPQHFIMPLLAHALGTFAGALAAYRLAASYRMQLAYVIGAFFLAGGIAASFMIPAPVWFIALDLLVAYLPMAWLAVQLGARIRPRSIAA